MDKLGFGDAGRVVGGLTIGWVGKKRVGMLSSCHLWGEIPSFMIDLRAVDAGIVTHAPPIWEVLPLLWPETGPASDSVRAQAKACSREEFGMG